MDIFTIAIWVITAGLLLFSLVMDGKKASVLPYTPGSLDKEKLQETIAACPVKAIEFHPPANMKMEGKKQNGKTPSC